MAARLGLVTGETSGDWLGAELLRSLRALLPDVTAEGIGGAHLGAEGLGHLYPMDRLAVMGLFEPLKRLPELLRARRNLRRHFLAHRPDVFVGIDSPDFNLPLEKALKAAGIPVAHYVSPSVWAWRRGRMRTIVRAVDLMLCLLPFETGIYRRAGVRHLCVGHPLAWNTPLEPDPEARQTLRAELRVAETAPLIAVLPGSRASEVSYNLPVLVATTRLLRRRYPEAVFAIPPASPERQRQIADLLAADSGAEVPKLLPLPAGDLASPPAGALLAAADVALVVMGTATLEAMLHKTPMVTTYRTGGLNYRLMRSLANLELFSLPNLLAGERLVPEILQSEATPERLCDAVSKLLDSDQRALRQRFAELHAAVRGAGPQAAAAAVAELAGWKGHAA